ncbi:MAG: VOC family protein [Myxococcota bacterium]
MAYTTNRFCWHGLLTTDTDKAGAFYPEVLGWKAEEMEMGGETATMFSVGGVPIAHYMKPPMDGVPSHWANYLRVDDVDSLTKKVVENGGKVIAEPTDIPPGRFSVIASPSGAALCLFHEADENTAQHHPGGTGGVHWTELHSKDIDKDLAWLRSTFGFETQDVPMPDGTYSMLMHGGERRGGAMKAMMEQAPSMWLTWFSVDNCDDALKRVTSNGGKTLSEAMDMPGVGRMAVVSDPTGGVFGVITPASA